MGTVAIVIFVPILAALARFSGVIFCRKLLDNLILPVEILVELRGGGREETAAATAALVRSGGAGDIWQFDVAAHLYELLFQLQNFSIEGADHTFVIVVVVRRPRARTEKRAHRHSSVSLKLLRNDKLEKSEILI